MRAFRPTPMLGFLAACSIGCTAKPSAPADGSGAADVEVTQPQDASTDGPEAAAEISRCGDLPEPYTPRRGGLCSVPGRLCSCYDDDRAACRSRLFCEGTHWMERRADCPPAPPTACPDSLDQANGQPCAPRLADCNYPGQGHCVCVAPTDPWGGVPDVCAVPSTPTWFCGYPDEGCPQGIPDLGTPCPRDGVRCGNPCVRLPGDLPLDRQCIDGAWQLAVRDTECV